MTPVRRRLLDCLPLFEYGLDTFLGLFEIEETDTIETAAVPLGKSPRLLINPAFVAQHCRTDQRLAALVLHELHHLLLGHTRLFKRITPMDNVAFDAVINAMICRRHPEPEWTAFFRDLYKADAFPECLLRPPEGFPGKPIWPDALNAGCRAALTDLYYTGSGTFHEVFALLQAVLPQTPTVFLLGSHDSDERGVDVSDDPALFAAIRRVVERWPMPKDPKVGRSLQNSLADRSVQVARNAPHVVLRRAILAAARPGRRLSGRFAPAPVAIDVAWPTRDRRAFALAAQGTPPLLQRADVLGRLRPTGLAPVDIYVDVSGSVTEYLPTLLGAIYACRAWSAPSVFQFSCGVHAVTLAELARGRVRTTGGTDGSSFTEHIAQRKSAAAVVLTDGYVGAIPDEHLGACRRARLQVVLTPGGWRNDLASAAAAFHQMESR